MSLICTIFAGLSCPWCQDIGVSVIILVFILTTLWIRVQIGYMHPCLDVWMQVRVGVCVGERWPVGADGWRIRVNYAQSRGDTVMAALQGMDCALWEPSRGFTGPRSRPLSSPSTHGSSLHPYLTSPPLPNSVTFSTLTSGPLAPQRWFFQTSFIV